MYPHGATNRRSSRPPPSPTKMDARCRAPDAAGHGDTGETPAPMTLGNHGVRRLRRSRSLPPTTNSRGYDDAGASGRTTTDGAKAAAASTTSRSWDAEPPATKRFFSLQFELPTSTEDLCGLLLLFVLLAPCCPWCPADQPAAMISYISWVSLLFCLYLYFLITSLSPATESAVLIFIHMSCPVVVGWLTAYYLSSFMGMILLYMNTFHAAGSFGYTLAEHHLRKRNAPAFRNLKSSKPNKATSATAAEAADPKGKPTTPDPAAFYVHLVSIACAVRVLWVCCALAPRIAVFETSVAVGFCLFSWTFYLHYWPLNQMCVDDEGMFKLTCCALMSFVLYASMGGDFFGEFGVVFGVWFTVAGIAGYYGYSLALCHCYKQLLRRPR